MKQSLLWKLTKDDYGEHYLLGTMHVKSEQAFQRLPQLKEIIKVCEVFAAEYDLNIIQNGQGKADMLISDGSTLIDWLGENKYKRIRKIILKSFGVDLKLFKNFLPLIIVNVISESVLTKDYGIPLDFYLWNYAGQHDLDLHGVESYDSQIKILKNIALKDQLKMLSQISRNPSKFRKNIIKMATWYQEENIDKLYKNGKKSLGKYKGILLKKRNHIMADRFEELSQKGSLLFAVGAGHLAGEYGVLKLLKEKGWKLQAI